MKNKSDYILYTLCISVIVAIAIQYSPNDQEASPAHKIVQRSTTDTFEKTSNVTTPTLTINLSKSHLAVESNHQYAIKLQALSNASERISWQYQALDGVHVAIKNNTLLVTVNDIHFKSAPLIMTFYNDTISIEKTVTLINVGEAIQGADNSMDNSPADQYNLFASHIAGNVMFDRLSFIESTADEMTSYSFNPDRPQQHPVRFMRINLRNVNDNIVARTYTDEFGRYQFNINTHSHAADFYIEVVSQMMIEDANNIRSFANVINQSNIYPENTTYRSLYHATSSVFRVISGDNQQDMRLKTGWHNTQREFEPQHSIAQPFAILDTLAKGFIYLHESGITLPKQQQMLTVTWSQDPDIKEDSTGYYSAQHNLIYISGNNALDTEQKPISTISEWNEHTILHEFGHFYLKKIVGRDDTQAGQHTAFGFGSLTLALSEGLANSLAKTILKDWQDKRVSFDIDKQQFVTNTQAILNNETSRLKRHFVNQAGDIYQRPFFDFSPFIEETVNYFILSIIDPRSQYSARTTKLSDDIGMLGLHQALLDSAQGDALMTIYSLAHALKKQHTPQAYLIDELGQQLDLDFHNQWGANQRAIQSHIIGHNALLLPNTVQYPFYQPVHIGQTNKLSFNGALQSLSLKRPGTLRYQRFVAPKDGRMIIRIPDAADDDENTHQFSFNIMHQGEIVAGSFYNEEKERAFSNVSVKKGEVYIIRTFDELFSDKDIHSELTVTTNMTLDYR